MAVDTQTKRRGAQNHPLFTIYPVPDGTIANVDRMQVSGWYGGITPASPLSGNFTIFGADSHGTVFGGMVISS
jgi:hypothetical protein